MYICKHRTKGGSPDKLISLSLAMGTVGLPYNSRSKSGSSNRQNVYPPEASEYIERCIGGGLSGEGRGRGKGKVA